MDVSLIKKLLPVVNVSLSKIPIVSYPFSMIHFQKFIVDHIFEIAVSICM